MTRVPAPPESRLPTAATGVDLRRPRGIWFATEDVLMNRIISCASFAAWTVLLGWGCQCKGGPLKVDRVEPEQGINAGGDTVTIRGSGFVPGKTQVEIRFGRD